MKYQNMKKMLACLLTGAVMAGCLVGCGDQQPVSSSSETQKASETQSAAVSETDTAQTIELGYPVEGDITLTLAMVEEAQVTANAADLAATPFGQAWQEATGINVEIMYVADDAAMNLLLASGDLPDIIYWDFSKYPGGIAAAISDGLVEPIDDYMQYAPDFQAVLDGNEVFAKGVKVPNGSIAGFPQLTGASGTAASGLFLRQDWLDELDMDMPETPEQLYDVLVAFRDKMGAQYPFTIGTDNYKALFTAGFITSPFDVVCANYHQIDGKVHYGYAEESFKGVLEWMHKLYEEGLLDPNFQTNDKNMYGSNMMNGVSGVTCGAGGSGLSTWMQTMQKEDPEYVLTGFGPLVAKEGDIPMYSNYSNPVKTLYGVITTSCENKEAAARLWNYGYTEEGQLLFNAGIKDVSYVILDSGEVALTDLIMNNPDLDVTMAKAQYMRSWKGFPYVKETITGLLTANPAKEKQNEATLQWAKSNAAEHALPTLIIGEDDAAEFSSLSTDLTTYIDEMVIKYITGLESLDTFETEYLPTLKKMGVDRAIEIQQKALDEYNSR